MAATVPRWDRTVDAALHNVGTVKTDGTLCVFGIEGLKIELLHFFLRVTD